MVVVGDIKIAFILGTAIMLFLVFGLLFLVLFYQNHFMKMKRNEANLLLKTALESEKNERERIAIDLHDGVQGDLNALKFTLAGLETGVLDAKFKAHIQLLQKTLQQTTENVRVISQKLMPPLLEQNGLRPAIEVYFEFLQLHSNVTLSLKGDLNDFELSSHEKYALFRLTQELIQNMLKHGQVSRIALAIENQKKELQITITDDGIPFDFFSAFEANHSGGLQNIMSRIKSIGATIKQVSDVGSNNYIIQLKRK